MMSRQGLTLIEVVVIILIFGVLAAILIPVLQAARERQRRTHCASIIKSLTCVCAIYASDFNGLFPNVGGGPADSARAGGGDAMASLGLIFPDYMNNGEVFVCPSARGVKKIIKQADVPPGERSAASMFTAANTDYGYDPDHMSSHVADVAIIADKGTGDANSPNHGGDGQNVGYVGGNVAWFGGPEGFHAGHEEDSIYTPGYKGSPAKVKAGVKVADKRLHSYIRQ